MRIFNSFEDISFDSKTVLTVGTFDGVHLGHQKMIERLKEVSKTDNLRHVLLTFDPHPQIVLQKSGKGPIRLLSCINERVKLFEKFGVENVFIIPFSFDFSQTSPEAFVKNYLMKYIGMSKILIGHDHFFGRNREGDRFLLSDLGREYGFEVEKISPFQLEDITISSTKIRHALIEGDLSFANKMLGYPYLVNGYVTKGLGRGTKLGYPTANIAIPDKHKQMPANGVYLVSGKHGKTECFGMANLGVRPTFKDNHDTILEINFFDFSGDIYMMEMSVSFLQRIRDEKKFANIDELKAQIKKDEEICRELINNFKI